MAEADPADVTGEAVLSFEGASFRVASKVGLMPLMKFAHLAKKGIDASDMDGLDAIYQLLRAVIADDEWDRFEDHASSVRADGDDLMGVVSQAIEVISQRPTARPSDSSDGPPVTSVSSADDSSLRVIGRLEGQGHT